MRPVVTAELMRAAEEAVIAAGTSVETLMDCAGTAAADAIRAFAGPLPALVICGPGNNGGDGYVIARRLRDAGVQVRVAAPVEPKTEAARKARLAWNGAIELLKTAEPAPMVIDALFGTGLSRPLDDAVASQLARLAQAASLVVAIDLPSGVATDDGAILSVIPDYQLTVAFGAMKPAHLLQPAARHMGRVVVADIGVPVKSELSLIERPRLRAPGPDDHKYTRGYVALLQGEMPGAGALSAASALRAGAGYVRVFGDNVLANIPKAVVQGGCEGDIGDPRIDVLALGPGLGRTGQAEGLLNRALGEEHPLVLDADALVLLEGRVDTLASREAEAILTPHLGEFNRLFGDLAGSNIDRVRAASSRSGAVILLKGADTVVGSPDGRVALARPAPSSLATAGTGDVLTGIVAAMRAQDEDAFRAACAAVWLHRRTAELAGPALVADDLVEHLPAALADCL